MAVLVFIGATSMSKRPHIAGLQLNVFIEYITKSQKESIILKIIVLDALSRLDEYFIIQRSKISTWNQLMVVYRDIRREFVTKTVR